MKLNEENNEPAADETAVAEMAEAGNADPAEAPPKPQPPELLFELARGLEQIDETGELGNAAAIVREIKKRYPDEFRAGSPAAVSINGGAGATATAPLTRGILAKMKPADIAKLDWQAVRHVLENTK